VREELGHARLAGLVDITHLLICLDLMLRLTDLLVVLGAQNLVHCADLLGTGAAFQGALNTASGGFDLVDLGLGGGQELLARPDHVVAGTAVVTNACHMSTPYVRAASVKPENGLAQPCGERSKLVCTCSAALAFFAFMV